MSNVRKLAYIVALISLPVVSSQAWSQGYGRERNIQIVCVDKADLLEGLDKVVNEQQIYNNSTDIFRRSPRCVFRMKTDAVSAEFSGWYLTNEYDDTKLNLWVPIHRVTFRDGLQAYRPDEIFRRKFWTLPDICLQLREQVTLRTGIVNMVGVADGTADARCDSPMPSNSRKRR